MQGLHPYLAQISNLCEKHNVKELYAFGSVLTGRFNEDSDVDLIVDFYPMAVDTYADNYFDLKFELEKILHRHIDLLEEKALKNPYFTEAIHKNRELIYGP
ncbi:MAG: nucleotidyltransferase domain-containing protein [Chitinophagales bacterium]